MEYKIAVVGDGGVGKSALTMQFVQNYCPEDYDPTIEDSYRKQSLIDDEHCMLQILDCAGEEEFSAFRDAEFKKTNGFLLVYSITSKDSFEFAPEYHEQLLRIKDREKIPIVIVGNKLDLNTARTVTKEEGKNIADKIGCPFFEVSALSRENLEDPFFQLIREIRKDSVFRSESGRDDGCGKK